MKKARIELLLLFILYLIIMPRGGMEYDTQLWTDWALYMHQHGLGNVYRDPTVNYLPGYLYCIYLYDMLQGTDANIIHNISSLKIFALCFDFLPIVGLCAMRQKIMSFKIPYLYLLLNVAYVFNSVVWGQADGIYANLVFLAVICSFCYPVTAILLYQLALNTKLQAIVMLPVVGMGLLYSVRSIRPVVIAIISSIALEAAIMVPFIQAGTAGKMISVAIHSVGYFNNLSISAFNVWYLIAPGNPYAISDKNKFLLLSYNTTGLLLFVSAASLLLVPMLRRIWLLRITHTPISRPTWQFIFLGCGMLYLSFFYFNTQMHERYAHPIIIFFFFYGAASRNYKLYVLASVAYFLSLDKSFSFPNGYLPIQHYKVIYASKIIALWYTAALVYGSYLYYALIKHYKRDSSLSPIAPAP